MEGLLLLFPLAISLIYKEPSRYPLSILSVATLVFTIGLSLASKKVTTKRFYAKEGFVIVSLSWILLSFFGALPFVLNGDIPSLVDAFFETASGFTTTGATVLVNVESLSYSMHFWRSFTQLIGGMGVLVFALAVLPKAQTESIHILKAEVPGPSFGKLVSKLSASARILYIIYLLMTAISILLLWAGGLTLFESTILGFGAAATGGFSMHNGSIGIYENIYVEMVLGITMLLSGINFNLYFMLINKQFKNVLKNEEIRWFLGITAGAIILISINLLTQYSVADAIRHSLFTVFSVVSTAGFATVDFNQWPLFSRLILMCLMFVGGMAGSTAGGLKVSRVAIMFKTALAELKKIAYPNRVVSIHFEQKPLEKNTIHSILNYLIVYIFVFTVILLFVSLDMPDFISAFSTVVAALNNIGNGLGVVGPASNFSIYSSFNKILLSFTMIMGRLEIFPILILFTPSIWRRKA